jgi:ferritin-like metal-binding protein YciE
MKLVHEKLPNLEELYTQRLRMLLSAEEQIVRGLPHMAEAAVDPSSSRHSACMLRRRRRTRCVCE